MTSRLRGPYGKIYLFDKETGLQISDYDDDILCDNSHDVLPKKPRTEYEGSPGINRCDAVDGTLGMLSGDAEDIPEYEDAKETVSYMICFT